MVEEIQVSLIGQPNVGKSCLFSRLTGINVVSSNYPGTTVEFNEGTITVDKKIFHIHDLPGTYSLSPNSNDERTVIEMIRSRKSDIFIIVADATNPEPSLVLISEILELNLPLIIAFNKYDLAIKKYDINIDKLSQIFEIPFIPVSSKTGEGINVLLNAISTGKARTSNYKVPYDGHIVECVKKIQNMNPTIKWGTAIKFLENLDVSGINIPSDTKSSIVNMQDKFMEIHGESVNIHLARDRYGNAHIITTETIKRKNHGQTHVEKFSEMTINPLTGAPILALVLTLTLTCTIFLGGYLSELFDKVYSSTVEAILSNFEFTTVEKTLINGTSDGIKAVLELVIPYIMIFYIILGVLEDTGYMPRAVVLLDRMMHKIGLHGNGFIPMMIGFGCNVPAILATRSIRSQRERIILCSLICMAVPCSAQLAIIAGVTGRFAGYVWSFVIVSTLIIIGACIGLFLNKKLPHDPSYLAIELPELEFPKISNIIRKMWIRTNDFFKLAVPLLILGSVIIELLLQYDLLIKIVQPMSWITVSLLGLPATTIIAFITGIIRKEMAYGMLAILAKSQDLTSFMLPHQFAIFGMVMATYFPCLAAIIALYHEFGIKHTFLVTASSMTVALIIGSGFNGILSVLNVLNFIDV
ncbi:MAG: ferrous iron transport protein B [archaeon]|nr:ferrous iron transport protein B [archaeon]